ncbi:MAG: hypothetical protein M0Z59_06925 [Nitrospiraceae bacterium]|nr:hypothetical protein [Nitrospiraceae bacterium]
MSKTSSFLVFLLMAALFIPFTNAASEAETAVPLTSMRDSVLSFFPPMKGDVISVKDGIITADLTNAPVLKEGMRLRVMRQGAEFYHPVTHEPLERLETPVGMAEITKAAPAGSVQLKIVQGEAKPGDVLRISRAKVRLLFYQLGNVSWGLGDEYYKTLSETGRFKLLASSLDDEASAGSEAQRLKADAVLVLSQEKQGGTNVLVQKLIWPDGRKVMVSGSPIPADLYKTLTIGDKLFMPKNESAAISFKVPMSTKHVLFANVDGKGGAELMLANGRKAVFYSYNTSALEPALNGAEIKGRSGDEFLRVSAADINGDGKDEIIIVSMNNGALYTAIYAYNNKDGFDELWRGNLVVREIDGKLYAQKTVRGEGYTGGVFGISFENGKMKENPGDKLNLPKGVDLYDFAFLNYSGKKYVAAFNGQDHVNVYDASGKKLLWTSPSDFGGFLDSFKRQSPGSREADEDAAINDAMSPQLIDRGKWSLKDRITAMGSDVIVAKRNRMAKVLRGIGYKDSQMWVLRWNGIAMQEMVLGDDLSGTIFDFAVTGDKLAVVASPVMNMEFSKILQGESPFTRQVYMYSLEGN